MKSKRSASLLKFLPSASRMVSGIIRPAARIAAPVEKAVAGAANKAWNSGAKALAPAAERLGLKPAFRDLLQARRKFDVIQPRGSGWRTGISSGKVDFGTAFNHIERLGGGAGAYARQVYPGRGAVILNPALTNKPGAYNPRWAINADDAYGLTLRQARRHELAHAYQANLPPGRFPLWHLGGKTLRPEALGTKPNQWRLLAAETQARAVEPGYNALRAIPRMARDASAYMRPGINNMPWWLARSLPRAATVGGGLGLGYGAYSIMKSSSVPDWMPDFLGGTTFGEAALLPQAYRRAGRTSASADMANVTLSPYTERALGRHLLSAGSGALLGGAAGLGAGTALTALGATNPWVLRVATGLGAGVGGLMGGANAARKRAEDRALLLEKLRRRKLRASRLQAKEKPWQILAGMWDQGRSEALEAVTQGRRDFDDTMLKVQTLAQAGFPTAWALLSLDAKRRAANARDRAKAG